jgi:hypothetical protein
MSRATSTAPGRGKGTWLAVGVLCLVAVAFGLKIWSDAGFLERLQAQGQLRIEAVEILDGDGATLVTVREPGALRAFGALCRDAQSPRSGRPEPGGETFEIHILSDDPMDLRGRTTPDHPGEIRGTFLDRGGAVHGVLWRVAQRWAPGVDRAAAVWRLNAAGQPGAGASSCSVGIISAHRRLRCCSGT